MPSITRHLLKLLGCAACVMLTLPKAQAQLVVEKHEQLPVENVWLIYSTDARLKGKWGLHADAQIRRTRNANILRQNQVRVGVNYYAAPQAIFTAGYSYISLYSADEAPTAIHAPENRFYEQFVLKDTDGLVRVDHRYRLEQRRLVRPGEEKPTYLNRVRYQLRLTMPLHGQEVKPGTPYVTGADELLFNFGRNATGGIFDQNRAYIALGYQFTKATSLEAGYLNQSFPAGGAMQQRHIAQLSVSFNPDLRPPADGSAQ